MSDILAIPSEPAPRRRGRPRATSHPAPTSVTVSDASAVSVTARGELEKTRRTVLARRLEGRVFGGGDRVIPMKEPHRWYVREANQLLNDRRFFEMVHEMGYVPVTAEDLAVSPESLGYRVTPDRRLVKGDRGESMLFKMPVEDRKKIDQRKVEMNMRGIGSSRQTKWDLANAAGTTLGSEAAEFLHKMPGEVIDTIAGVEQK